MLVLERVRSSTSMTIRGNGGGTGLPFSAVFTGEGARYHDRRMRGPQPIKISPVSQTRLVEAPQEHAHAQHRAPAHDHAAATSERAP